MSPELGVLDEGAFDELFDDDADVALGLLAELCGATDAGLRALARSLAARLFLDVARRERADAPGIGRIVTTRYQPGAGDLDIDSSMAAIIESRAAGELVDPEALRVRAWSRPSEAFCVLVDRSGSMHGEPLATAGLTAASVAAREPREYAVLSFGKTVIAPKSMWEVRSADNVIERTLALRGHGTTDVASALMAADDQLRHASAQRRITVLLSDCRATEPGDYVAAARRLDELVIVAPESDPSDARALAEAVGARVTTVSGPSDIPAAIARVLN